MDKKELSAQERTALAEKLALSYFHSYRKESVKDGVTYAGAWTLAEDATYYSPYFVGETIRLGAAAINFDESSAMEALSYSIEFDDWKPVDFKYYPSEHGVAWKTHFMGRRKDDGQPMGFFAYSYLDINVYGEITHWETHVNRDYDVFLDKAIGTHGPFHGMDEYMQAVCRKLASAGIDINKLMKR